MGKGKKMSLKRKTMRYIKCLMNFNENVSDDEKTTWSSLPIDLKAIILSKLDMATLYHCSLACPREFNLVLPRITALSSALPPSMYLLPRNSTTFLGRLLNNVVKELSKRYHGVFFTASTKLSPWLNRPRMCSSGRRFIQTLVGLKSLELEVPPSAFANYLPRPRLRFRWDLKFGINPENNRRYSYFFYVVGFIPNQLDDGEEVEESVTVAMSHMHSLVSWMLNVLGDPMSEKYTKLRRLVIKHSAKNGRLEVTDGVDSMRCLQNWDYPCSGMMYCVPTLMVVPFKIKNNYETLVFERTYLYFDKWEEVVRQDNGDNVASHNSSSGGSSSRRRRRYSVNELQSDCVGYFKNGGEREDDDHREMTGVGELVSKILAHDRRRLESHW